MALRASRMYDPASRSIILANGIPLTMDNMVATGQTKEYTELVFKLCHDMADLNSDNAEYALFTAISIFSGIESYWNFLLFFFLILRDEDFFLTLLQVILVGPCVVTVELTTDHTRECQICCQIKFADKL